MVKVKRNRLNVSKYRRGLAILSPLSLQSVTFEQRGERHNFRSGGVLTSRMVYLLTELNQTLSVSNWEPTWQTPILVALGAIPGALSRYYITVLAIQRLGNTFPYGTFIINLTGSGLIGFLSIWVGQQIASENLQALLIIGFLGAYTTFSTYALDTSNLLQVKRHKPALFYWLGSPILGFFCVEIGIFLARQMIGISENP